MGKKKKENNNKVAVGTTFAGYKTHWFGAPVHTPFILKATKATQL